MPIYFPPSSGGGGVDPNTAVSFANTVSFTGIITPTQITADANNYAPSGYDVCNHMRLNTDTTRTITGLAGGTSGRLLIITNIGAAPLQLSHESANSTANNRFNFTASPNAAFRTLYPGRSEWFKYDGTSGRWRDLDTKSRAVALDIQTGTDDEKYVTSLSLVNASSPQTLVDGANVAWNMANGFNAELTIVANRTIDAPTNYKKGLNYALTIQQANGGLKTLTWASCYNWGQAGAPTLSTANGKIDLVTAYCYDANTSAPKFRMGFNRDV